MVSNGRTNGREVVFPKLRYSEVGATKTAVICFAKNKAFNICIQTEDHLKLYTNCWILPREKFLDYK